MGELLASLVLHEKPEFPLEGFSLGRFSARAAESV
jgi:hypothetical protein